MPKREYIWPVDVNFGRVGDETFESRVVIGLEPVDAGNTKMLLLGDEATVVQYSPRDLLEQFREAGAKSGAVTFPARRAPALRA